MSQLASMGATVEETETQEEGEPSPIRHSLVWKPVSSCPRLLGLGPLPVSLRDTHSRLVFTSCLSINALATHFSGRP